MGSYTTQLSFGALQFERIQKWMSREKYPGKLDSFIREKFLELLDKEQPSNTQENQS